MLEREGMQFAPCIWPVPSASSRCISPHQPLTVTKLVDTPLISQVLITGVVDDCEPAYTSLTSNWTITLRAGERNFSVSVAVAVTDVTVDVAMVGISIYLADPISVGIYERARSSRKDKPSRTSHHLRAVRHRACIQWGVKHRST